MVTFIKMVITRVKNGSPDMILTAFEGKFDEKKDELPPEAHRPLKTVKKKQCRKMCTSNKLKKTWWKRGHRKR